jgi:SAM-dependent methyltransferase
MIFAGNEGYCSVCAAQTTFIVKGQWLRDQYICPKCSSIPRQRALAKLLNDLRPNWREEAIHESSPTLRFYAEQCARYSYSFFFPDVPCGSSHTGHRCENIEALTFHDHAFDIFITQDVLEHVFRPDRALSEVMRVLRDGGIHIFTAPKHKTLLKSRQRAREVDGQIEHLLPPQYHGNPISELGSLVTGTTGRISTT